ncbi:hypothetical protein HID58_053194, partial [Brassica napus]
SQTERGKRRQAHPVKERKQNNLEYQELEKPTTETTISHHYRSKVQNFFKMRVESIKARKKGEEPFDNAGNMNSPSGEQTSPCSSSTHTPEKWISRASEIDRDGGGVGEEGRDGGGGEATETAAIPVVEVSKSNRINPLGREREMREMRERQRHRVMVTHVTKRRAFQALRKRR